MAEQPRIRASSPAAAHSGAALPPDAAAREADAAEHALWMGGRTPRCGRGVRFGSPALLRDPWAAHIPLVLMRRLGQCLQRPASPRAAGLFGPARAGLRVSLAAGHRAAGRRGGTRGATAAATSSREGGMVSESKAPVERPCPARAQTLRRFYGDFVGILRRFCGRHAGRHPACLRKTRHV